MDKWINNGWQTVGNCWKLVGKLYNMYIYITLHNYVWYVYIYIQYHNVIRTH